ncbi:MAG: polysaccharide pyruvyl transferase family protein [Desulforhopalus sp.]|jgi:polysaccharide pyruvyl transferase WcaK-like protein|nr:polysaccharide pyruvyl transferase family protein [Desulforhopalus sp.]
MKTITILGNNSGRNAGDNAILGNMLDDFALLRSDIHFKIPTLSPDFIRKNFGHHRVEPIGLLPWNLALKNLGWPMYRAMTDTQMVLIVDNILFDRKLYNPFVNNLFSISLFAPFCKNKNIPIILYNGSIGPIDRQAGGHALRKVLENSPLVITRDSRTKELLDRLQINHPEVVIHADCALNTEIPAAGRLDEIIRKEGLFTNPQGTIGLNVNAYIDDFNQQGKMNRQDFCKIIAETADRLIDTLNVDILFTVSQIMDMAITRECVNLSRHGQRIRIVGNCDYTYQELAGLLSKVDIHAGLRTHTLIFCAAVNTPMVNINAYPKSAGFINTIGMGDYTITFEQLNTESLTKLIVQCWKNRSQLRTQMKPIVDEEKRKARASVNLVSSILDRL